jgi:subtilisin family serine protease
MPGVWDKIDTGLAIIYDNYIRFQAGGGEAVRPLPVVAERGKLHVELQYEGSIQPAEDAGFETRFDDGQGQATGALRLEDLEAIAAPAEVLSIRYGSVPQLGLDKSIPQINADKVWTYTPPATFSGPTGSNALVGVIDTGVDIHHPSLWLRSRPVPVTRILRIWDQGLEVVGPEKSPDVGLLTPGTPGTYGVEYEDKHINDVLQAVVAAPPVRHKDCSGHGTHVAATAAGDGRFKFAKVGVAPRAELVIVKYFYLQKDPPKVGVTDVGPNQRFKDAVSYLRNVADLIGKPIAINYSGGSQLGAHDGLDPQDAWLSTQFEDATSAGKIFVTAAGNSAGASQHALIVFTGAGSVELDFELIDSRPPAAMKDLYTCASKDATQDMWIQFWYPNGGATVAGAFKPHGAAGFTPGPALNGGQVPGVIGGHPYALRHREDIGTGGAKRNLFEVHVGKIADTLHRAGTYTVRLTSTGAIKIHVWCYQYARDQRFKLKAAPPPAPHVTVTVNDENLIWAPGCAKNLITVAAYDAESGPLPVVWFSSRGPVPSHGVGAPPAKPDLAAPGWNIDAAKSKDITPPLVGPTQPMSGTSMATPHVAGTVALMLHKKKTLTPSQVLGLLQANALKVPPPNADETGSGRLDAKKTFDSVSP